MTRRRLVTTALVAVVVLAGAAVAVTSLLRLRPGIDVPVVEVRREPFVRRVYAEGYLKAAEATPVTSPIEVREPLKIAWMADDGSRVRAGEVVIRFDPTTMEKNLADGEADRSTVDNRTTKRTVERDTQFDTLGRNVDLAEYELEHARRFQSTDEEIFSRHKIIEAEIDERLATERQEKAEQGRQIQSELAGADLELLAIERRKAVFKIEQAQQGLNSLEVRAPHDGILVFQRNWRGELPGIGDEVWGGQQLAEIPQLEEMEAEVFVLEADAGGLAPELPAAVWLEAHQELAYTATVTHVDALAKRKKRWVPLQYFGVILELERTDPELMKPGQRVRAELRLDEREQALIVPREAVFERDGSRVVYRQSGFGFEAVAVVVGPATLGRVVIEQGLDEGDLIGLADPAATSGSEPAKPETNGGVGGALQ